MRFTHSAILGFLLLASCAKQVVVAPDLPPEEVLKRSSQASRNLRSAQYVVEGEFTSEDSSAHGTVRIDGSLADAGKQVHFLADFTGNFTDPAEEQLSVNGLLEIVVLSESEVYMNLQSLQVQPQTTMISPVILSKFAGRWWKLPADIPSPVVTDVAPDPSLLRAQSEVVRVTQDRGPEVIFGRTAFHYEVEIDHDKFAAFLRESAKTRGSDRDLSDLVREIATLQSDGELWIDAESFQILSTRWNLSGVPLRAGSTSTATLNFKADLRNHNAAQDIIPPKDAVDFDPSMLLTPGLTDEQAQLLLPEDDYSFTDQLQVPTK